MPLFILPSNPVARGWLVGVLLTIPFLLGADDNYLREIEEEAKRQATTLITSPVQSGPAPTDAAPERLASGLNQAAFERALREALPGTYAFYQRLDPASQQQVYASYQNDSRLAGISAQIVRLLDGKL